MALSCEKGRIESGTWVGNVKDRYEKDTKCLARDLFRVMTKKGGTLLRLLRLVRKSIWPDHTSEIWITERYLFLHYIK